MLGTFGYTQKRNKIIDYTLPTSFSSMALLIPKPTMQKKNYALAVIEPFQSQVPSYRLTDSIDFIIYFYD